MRRRDLLVGLGAGLTGLGLAGATGWAGAHLGRGRRLAVPVLVSEGLVIGADGLVRALEPGVRCEYLPGTRVVASWSQAQRLGVTGGAGPGGLAEVAQRESGRLAAARVPAGGEGVLADLLALTGAHLAASSVPVPAGAVGAAGAAGATGGEAGGEGVLRFPRGGVVAAPMGYWRYVWPRDASFAAAALAAVGLLEEAASVLACLGRFQDDAVARRRALCGGGRRLGPGSAGWAAVMAASVLEARYLPDGTVPDARPAQLDGVGWLLWAAGRVAGDATRSGLPPAQVAGLLEPVAAVLARSRSHLLWLTAGPDRLPPVSPDYWEVAERRLTLGVAAPVLLGLEAAAALEAAGLLAPEEGRSVGDTGRRAAQVRAAVESAFAPGWGRHAGDDDVDAAIAFVLPPFTEPLAGALPVRERAVARMRRPAGGVAPGSGWRRDGVSWTPETALMAWSAAALARHEAVDAARREAWSREAGQLLRWLGVVRTGVGALPEKVRADGRPAGPAPLAWTSALVLLALAERFGGWPA